MNIEHILAAIAECDAGNLRFSTGSNRHAFLYKRHWYPLRNIVNRASILSNEWKEYTTDDAAKRLRDFFPYLRFDRISFENQLPVPADPNEILNEARLLTEALHLLLG